MEEKHNHRVVDTNIGFLEVVNYIDEFKPLCDETMSIIDSSIAKLEDVKDFVTEETVDFAVKHIVFDDFSSIAGYLNDCKNLIVWTNIIQHKMKNIETSLVGIEIVNFVTDVKKAAELASHLATEVGDFLREVKKPQYAMYNPHEAYLQIAVDCNNLKTSCVSMINKAIQQEPKNALFLNKKVFEEFLKVS